MAKKRRLTSRPLPKNETAPLMEKYDSMSHLRSSPPMQKLMERAIMLVLLKN